jgi:hypothetical protein
VEVLMEAMGTVPEAASAHGAPTAPCIRTSENTCKAKFAEFTFHALE